MCSYRSRIWVRVDDVSPVRLHARLAPFSMKPEIMLVCVCACVLVVTLGCVFAVLLLLMIVMAVCVYKPHSRR